MPQNRNNMNFPYLMRVVYLNYFLIVFCLISSHVLSQQKISSKKDDLTHSVELMIRNTRMETSGADNDSEKSVNQVLSILCNLYCKNSIRIFDRQNTWHGKYLLLQPIVNVGFSSTQFDREQAGKVDPLVVRQFSSQYRIQCQDTNIFLPYYISQKLLDSLNLLSGKLGITRNVQLYRLNEQNHYDYNIRFSRIIFSPKLKSAVVYYSLFKETWCAYFENIKNDWFFRSTVFINHQDS